MVLKPIQGVMHRGFSSVDHRTIGLEDPENLVTYNQKLGFD